MYNNLEAEIKRKNLKKEDIAKTIGKTYITLTLKMAGKYPFTFDEAEKIYTEFFPECDFVTLFRKF